MPPVPDAGDRHRQSGALADGPRMAGPPGRPMRSGGQRRDQPARLTSDRGARHGRGWHRHLGARVRPCGPICRRELRPADGPTWSMAGPNAATPVRTAAAGEWSIIATFLNLSPEEGVVPRSRRTATEPRAQTEGHDTPERLSPVTENYLLSLYKMWEDSETPTLTQLTEALRQSTAAHGRLGHFRPIGCRNAAADAEAGPGGYRATTSASG